MKIKELVRWGVPALAFVAYVYWGGINLAFLLAGILFTLISVFINWHEKDPEGFHMGARAWIVVLLLVPAVGLTIVGALTSPVLMMASVLVLALALFLLLINNKKIKQANSGFKYDRTRDWQDFMYARHQREEREFLEKMKEDERLFQEELKEIEQGKRRKPLGMPPQPPK